MRKFAFLLSALLSISLVTGAYAGSNIVQKDTGATVWEDDSGTQSPVGDSGLTVNMPTVSTASTVYVVSHKKGTLVKAYAIAYGITANSSEPARLDFHVLNATTQGWFEALTGTVAGASAVNRLTMLTTATGSIASVTFADITTSTAQVDAGDVIAIHTDGVSTGAQVDNATIVLIIE